MRNVLIVLLFLAFFGLTAYLFIAAAHEIERRHQRWEWEHPPEEDACREDDEKDRPE